MNKIYKVIWSKTRNCYVAVAEFVKRNGKGGSVLNRRHVAAALKKLQQASAICDGVGLAAPFTCRHVAAALAAVAICAAPVSGWAENRGGALKDYPEVPFDKTYVGVDDNGDIDPSDNIVRVEQQYENGVELEYIIGGYTPVTAEVGKNTVEISGDGLSLKNVYGGYSTDGNAVDNVVTVDRGTIVEVYGGYSQKPATGNTVFVKDGKLDFVYGGYSTGGNAGGIEENKGNAVSITGGTISKRVSGGFSEYDALCNTVSISGGYIGGGVYGGVYGGYSGKNVAAGNAVTIKGNATIQEAVYGGYSKEATGNKVTVEGGTVNNNVHGGYSNEADATGNAVTVSGGTVYGDVYGGYSDSKDAVGNTVSISDGYIDGGVYGGYSASKDAVGNTVTVSGGNVKKWVYGGYSSKGTAKDNTVILSKKEGHAAPTINGGVLCGGVSYNNPCNNTLQVEAVNVSALEIRGFDNYNFVLPTDVRKDDTLLQLMAQDEDLTINGKSISVSAASGTVAGMGLQLGDKVTLLEKIGGQGAFKITDFDHLIEERLDGVASGLIKNRYSLIFQGETYIEATLAEKYLYGEGGANTPGQRETKNTLTITDGKANVAFGGRAARGAVTENNVIMSGGEIVITSSILIGGIDVSGDLYGGFAEEGDVKKNTVKISGGTVHSWLMGGYSLTGAAKDNSVTVSGGTVNDNVYGGNSPVDATGNAVTVSGGTVKGDVYGGRSLSAAVGTISGAAKNNTVTIAGGTFISGGTENNNVYGGFSKDGDATGNVVNLTGVTHGQDEVKLYGYNDDAASHSGNELHIGGAKTYDENGGAVITKGSWQGMDSSDTHTNKVNTVANFDSIALHNVVWGNVPALWAKNMDNIGGLDVTGLEFYTDPDDSTVHNHALKDHMVLVRSSMSGLTGLNISYLDEGSVKTERLTNQGINYGSAAHNSEKNGVTVGGKEVKRIYLADNNKSVDFLYCVDGEKITLGNVEFVKDGTARSLDGGFDVKNAGIDADNLQMTAESMKSVNAGDSMTVVDAEGAIKAKGATATMKAFTDKTYDVAFSDGVTARLNLGGTHTDTLSQNAARTKLTYTVGEKKVSDAAFGGELAWSGGATHYTNTNYNFNTDANTDLKGLTFTTAASDPLGQSMTLIGGKVQGTVENAPRSFKVSLDKANVTLDATASGRAAIANGDLAYTVTGVALDKVTVNQVTDTADAVPDGWTLAKDSMGNVMTYVNTDGMILPDDMEAGTVRTVLTANSTEDFYHVSVYGKNVFKVHESFTEEGNGVTVTGGKTGGVKKSADNKAIVYQAIKDHVSDVTLGDVEFVKDGTARAFTKAYDVLTANIDADGFKMTDASMKGVEAGDFMMVVDAEDAIKNAKGETLKAFADKTYDVAFSDSVTRRPGLEEWQHPLYQSKEQQWQGRVCVQ